MNQDQPLFSKNELREVLEATKFRMKKEIEDYPQNKLLNTSPDDLAKYFREKYELLSISIKETEINVDMQETKVEFSQFNRYFDKSYYVPGTMIILNMPFDGDKDLFYCQPSTFTFNPPHGFIRGDVLQIKIVRTDHDVKEAKDELNNLINDVKKYIGWIKSDIEPFNSNLLEIAKQQIDSRRQKILKDQGLLAGLGFPIKTISNPITTYISPEIRRKQALQPPPSSSQPYNPEPILAMEEYENILSIIQKTASMLERSPRAFREMEEESLRDQFLVPLNSHYEGQTTGETFNFSGKSDILIRDRDRSVFVAECKIWRGPKSLSNAIDQILGYATWRDTKTAILVFNRNKKLTEVLLQIPDILQSHPNYKRELKSQNSTFFRCIIAHRDDPNRELILTVLVFEVPN